MPAGRTAWGCWCLGGGRIFSVPPLLPRCLGTCVSGRECLIPGGHLCVLPSRSAPVVCHSHPLRSPVGRAGPLPGAVMSSALLRPSCTGPRGEEKQALRHLHSSPRDWPLPCFLCDSTTETALSPSTGRARLEEERGDHTPGWIAEAPAAHSF